MRHDDALRGEAAASLSHVTVGSGSRTESVTASDRDLGLLRPVLPVSRSMSWTAWPTGTVGCPAGHCQAQPVTGMPVAVTVTESSAIGIPLMTPQCRTVVRPEAIY